MPLVPWAGLEPARLFRSKDFKSFVSTYSTTTAYIHRYYLSRFYIIHHHGIYPSLLPNSLLYYQPFNTIYSILSLLYYYSFITYIFITYYFAAIFSFNNQICQSPFYITLIRWEYYLLNVAKVRTKFELNKYNDIFVNKWGNKCQ